MSGPGVSTGSTNDRGPVVSTNDRGPGVSTNDRGAGVSTGSTNDHGSTNDRGPAPAAVVDTPRLLTRWQLVGTVLLVAFGVVSAALQFVGYSADGDAADDTEQLVRVQEVQSSLLRADALATNAFLVEGAEPAAQRAEYDAAIESALGGITDAAQAQSADSEELAALNVAVHDYAAAVARARSLDEEGVAEGARDLAGASADLRGEALPILAGLVEANTERAEDAMGGHRPVLLVLVGLLALAGLWWLHRRLAQTFRRHVNVGVAMAAVIVAVTTGVTAAAGFVGEAGNDEVRDGAFRTAVDQAAARTAANDAKASESLRLIQRGSGGGFEEAWQESADVVEARGAEELDPLWEEYAADHAAIVQQLEEGNREEAVDAAVSEDSDAATAALDAYDDASQAAVDEAAADATQELRDDRWLAVLLGLLTLVAAAVALTSFARGIGQRRKEFA